MQYAVLRVRGERTVVALVERWQLGGRHAPDLVEVLQRQFALPAVLVANDDSCWRTARAYAANDSDRQLFDLLAGAADIDWQDLPATGRQRMGE
ncbi:hypothetical protein [Massilia timonae]|uniref:hypothetical protein n=1 Tax=Massilia timonae TaxID=47229 RepID=UPI0008F5CA27|nr:hypothetical protein [Massilia timonae]